MKPKNAAKVFLTLISLFLVCTSSALASDQVQQQTGIIDELKNNCNTLLFHGEVLLSEASYKISHFTNNQYFTSWIRKSSSFIPISKYFSVKCLKS